MLKTEDCSTGQAPSARARLHYLWNRRVVYASGVLALILLLTSSTHVRIAMQSAAFLNEVFPAAPVYMGRWLSDEPYRVMVQFPHEDTYQGAYLYHPGRPGCYGGIVLYIGLGPEHGDPHLDRISRAFARNGYVVLIPVSDAMINYRLDADEHEIAASAFEFLQFMPEVDQQRVGMFGISVGGAIVANAAQEFRIQDEVSMVLSLGGYYDARMVLGQMGVGAFEVEGAWKEWEPSSTTFRATRNSIVPYMPSDDRAALWQMFTPDATEIPDGLSSDGRSLAAVLTNDDPQLIDPLIDELPHDVLEFLDRISPASDLMQLEADTYLLHDRYDHVLPYSESVRFSQDAQLAGLDQVHLTIIEQFHHVRPDEDGSRVSLMADGARLFKLIYRMHRSLDDRGLFTSPLDLVGLDQGETRCD
jgi:hypothetical protein